MLNTIFMGTPAIAVPALQRLAARTRVRLVVTQPDRPAGRGNQLRAPEVKQAAQLLGIDVWQPETLRGGESDPRLQGCDLFVVMAYGELLRQGVLDLPKACINLHASLLPRWRGASPLQAAIRAQDRRTGVTVMGMVRALDAGPIYLQQAIDLPGDATLPWLHDRMAEEAAVALERFLDAWPGIQAIPQEDTLVTHCRKLDASDGRIEWSQSMAEIDAQVRAYTPAPGCWAPLTGSERLRILAVAPDPGAAMAQGTVACVDGIIRVGCADGRMRILRLQAPGRSALDAADFLRGSRLPERI